MVLRKVTNVVTKKSLFVLLITGNNRKFVKGLKIAGLIIVANKRDKHGLRLFRLICFKKKGFKMQSPVKAFALLYTLYTVYFVTLLNAPKKVTLLRFKRKRETQNYNLFCLISLTHRSYGSFIKSTAITLVNSGLRHYALAAIPAPRRHVTGKVRAQPTVPVPLFSFLPGGFARAFNNRLILLRFFALNAGFLINKLARAKSLFITFLNLQTLLQIAISNSKAVLILRLNTYQYVSLNVLKLGFNKKKSRFLIVFVSTFPKLV
ncbi:hypothetical protein GGTG_04843 [Gaeumannomyces tritici R3-111a-1]|uniref:Uncharacterized protein n=1 Tax=Gaeumannomyces tritici (strain R3-111a-1) TaxID=644352 RepID=J3NU88_GAET3|nr:hypothetical protein GGTG_04843 [Gaeumannomyces tritici R3-111a-1]EJT79759.1 hypothetical protein GGTG_04843 [Gaeumannomyces tritici R3-111a-1]